MTATVTGLEEIDRLLSRLPDQVQKELTAALAEYAAGEQDRIRAAARRVSAQAALAARSVTAGRTRDGGRISAGGSVKITGRVSGGDLFFGAEFGGGARPQTRQFRPYEPRGYWFFPTLRDDEDRMVRMIAAAVDEALRS